MPADDLSLLIDFAQEAGRIAKQYWREDPEMWDKPDGHGPVTEADLAIDKMLRANLLAARPDYGWLSEETEDDLGRLSKQRVFVVDPIDGTRSFIAGERSFSHSLAVVENGVVTAGVVYLPMLDRLYTAGLGFGAQLNGEALQVAMPKPETETQVLAARPNMDAENWPGGTPLFRRTYRPSLAYRMALVGQGRFDGMLTLRQSWEWDIAAGTLIVQEAGGRVLDRTGQALRFNNAKPRVPGVIAAEPGLHARLMARRSGQPLDEDGLDPAL